MVQYNIYIYIYIIGFLGVCVTPSFMSEWKPLFALEVELPKGQAPPTMTSTVGRTYKPVVAFRSPSKSAKKKQQKAPREETFIHEPSVRSSPWASKASSFQLVTPTRPHPQQNQNVNNASVPSPPTFLSLPEALPPTIRSEASHSTSLFRGTAATSMGLRSLQEEILEEIDANVEQNIFVDNYGFFVSMDEKAAESAYLRQAKVSQNLAKWESKIFPRFDVLTQDEKKHCCRRGVPQEFRKDVWLKLLEVHDVSSRGPKSNSQRKQMTTFKELAAKPFTAEQEEKYGSIIEKDLPRTFSTNLLFDSSVTSMGQEYIRRVLRAYCHRDKEVGYCQGMASIAATLVIIMENDYDAYICFCALMENRKYNMRNYYKPGFPELNCSLAVLESLVKKTASTVWRVLDRFDISYSIFATSWMLTLFSHSFNFRLVCRIWDMFLCEGWKPMYRVIIALLKMEEDKMIAITEETKLLLLLQHCTEEKDWNQLLKQAKSVGFKTSLMQKLRNENI